MIGVDCYVNPGARIKIGSWEGSENNLKDATTQLTEFYHFPG